MGRTISLTQNRSSIWYLQQAWGAHRMSASQGGRTSGARPATVLPDRSRPGYKWDFTLAQFWHCLQLYSAPSATQSAAGHKWPGSCITDAGKSREGSWWSSSLYGHSTRSYRGVGGRQSTGDLLTTWLWEQVSNSQEQLVPPEFVLLRGNEPWQLVLYPFRRGRGRRQWGTVPTGNLYEQVTYGASRPTVATKFGGASSKEDWLGTKGYKAGNGAWMNLQFMTPTYTCMRLA